MARLVEQSRGAATLGKDTTSWMGDPETEQPSLLSKKRQWSVKIRGQFFDFPSRLAKVEVVGLYLIVEAL